MALALAYAAGASAISAPIHIAGTGGQGVFIRPTPDTSQPAIGWMAEGTSPDYHCFTYGQMIGNVNVWFNVTNSGITGYYASYYDDSSYHSEAELTAKYGIPKCGAPAPSPPPPAPTPPPPSPAPPPAPGPAGTLVFPVFNADGGIYYRQSPRWGDTKQTPGDGVYNGDRVQLICGESGDPVGPYNNMLWSYVQNLTRPTIGDGWVNEHYINDGAPSGHLPAGEPTPCPASVPGSAAAGGSGSSGSAPPAPTSGPQSVFYSPLLPTGGIAGVAVADRDLSIRTWTDGKSDCSPVLAASSDLVPDTVTTLAGWSRGRLGPMYFLAYAGESRVARIHRIVLFDPGNLANMQGPDTCDWSIAPSINWLLDNWLASNSQNTLLILTGHDSEEHEFGSIGRSDYTGLWTYYLRDLWGKPYANRALICDYNNETHFHVLQHFYGVVRYPPAGCPVSPDSPPPVAWNP
jgi:hypothetical protein